MKKLFLLTAVTFFISLTSYSQETIYTDGPYIFGPCGDTLDLRGVNYAPFNWGYSPDDLFIDEIAETGANSVRLVWYIDGGNEIANAVYQDPAKLREVLSACIDYDMIPILELHDATCQNDYEALIELTDWYLQDWVLEIIEDYSHSLIINLFNESLYIDWTGDVTTGEQLFEETYATIIKKVRAAGIDVPLMIDGSECGTNLWSLANVATALIEEDPESNLIFSTHTYWWAYANTTEEMDDLFDHAAATDLPFLVGELANYQDDQTECEHALNYQYLMELCDANNMGWMAWSWDRDNCGLRQMTEDGLFANLTTFGENIVNHPLYGLSTNPPIKSSFLINDFNCTVSTTDLQKAVFMDIYPNPASTFLTIDLNRENNTVYPARIYDTMGRTIVELSVTHSTTTVDVSHLSSGIYFMECNGEILKFIME